MIDKVKLSGSVLLVVLGICSWTAYSILAQRWFAPDRASWLMVKPAAALPDAPAEDKPGG